MREKPKIIRDILKDKKINDMWALLDPRKNRRQKRKEQNEKTIKQKNYQKHPDTF